MAPALLALGARVNTLSSSGKRTLKIHELIVDAYSTDLGEDEVVTQVLVPIPQKGSGGVSLKFERRAGDFAVASVGVQISLQKDGTCSEIAVGLGAVGVTAIRARKAEEVLRGKQVDDAGERLNPLIVEGQIYGAIGHQMGAALYERLIYDESGQLLTSSFKDYSVPTALDFPKFEVDYLDTPSLATPWGARGVGEGGGSPLIVVSSAVSDALAPFDVEIKSTHVTSEDVLRALID